MKEGESVDEATNRLLELLGKAGIECNYDASDFEEMEND